VREAYLGLDVTPEIASLFAALAAHLRRAGLAARLHHTWIATTALAHDAGVCTQDADFDALEGVHGLELVRV
jgi:predicted nucleic acid-binding protein